MACLPSICPGAMNAGVPIIVPGNVSVVACSSGRAIPKSVMTVRVPSNRMLSGFRSRCTTPASRVAQGIEQCHTEPGGLRDG